MDWKTEWKKLTAIVVVFLLFFWLPVGWDRFTGGIMEALHLAKWYAREHVLLCLVPAFFIAGAIGVFISQASVMKYLGAKADEQMTMPEPRVRRPLWQNAAFFAVMIGILVFANWGAPNQFAFTLNDGRQFNAAVVKAPENPAAEGAAYSLKLINGTETGEQVSVPAVAVESKIPTPGTWTTIWQNKWLVTAGFAVALSLVLVFWFGIRWWKVILAATPAVVLALILPMQGLTIMIPFAAAVVGLSAITSTHEGEAGEWFASTWTFAKQILPLLFFGVLVAGFLLGRVDHEGLIPSKYVQMLVGDRPDTMLAITGWGGGGFESFVRAIWPLWTNFFSSVFGAFMYFATLTEVPILQGLIGSGMGKGPALVLLLAGPVLSLPSMLVIRSIMGTQKTVVFISLVVVMATVTGMIFGTFF